MLTGHRIGDMTTLSQLRILVDDFPASFRFYRDVLCLSPQSEEQESGPYACFKFADGGTDLALFSRKLMAAGTGAEPAAPRGAVDHAVVVFRVDDVDAAYAEAVAAGARSAAEPADQTGWGMRVAHLRAPEGTLIEFCSY
jgi:predicted enzyme related to lactoylglutathione lyase